MEKIAFIYDIIKYMTFFLLIVKKNWCI